MKIKITRIGSGKGLEKVFTGEARTAPRVGESFRVVGGYTFETDAYTDFKTSPVTDVLGGGKFRTANGSLYKVEILARTWN